MATAATIDVILKANTAQYRAAMIDAGRVANQNLGAIRKESAATAQSIQTLNRAAAGFLGFQALSSGIGALIEARKSIEAIKFGLVSATGSAAGAEKAYGFVAQTAKELGLNLQSAAKDFTRLSASATAAGVSMSDQQKLYVQLARSATALRLTELDVTRATNALSQSFSKGKFQAEELRQQLSEAVPGAFARFQKNVLEMTKGTELADKSFDDLLKGGLLDVQTFLPAMVKALEQTGGGAEDAAKGLAAELNRLSSEWFKLKAETSDGVFSDVAITSVRLMHENLSAIAGLATIAGGVLAARVAGKGIQSGIDAAAGFGAGIAARKAETAATVQATAETVAHTRAALIDAEATAARARAAYGGSIAADLAAVTATKAHTAALREHAAAQAADKAAQVGIAGRAGAGALELVGGVPGAVILGLGALAIGIANVAREAKERQEQMESYRQTLEDIGISAYVAAEDLSRGGGIREAAQQYRELALALKEPQKEIEKLQKRYDALLEAQRSGAAGHMGLGIHGDGLVETREALEKLQAEIKPTQAQFDALGGQLREQLGPAFDQVRASVLKMTDVEYGKWLRAQTPDVQQAIGQLDELRKAAERSREGIANAIISIPGQIERIGKSAREVARLDVRDWIRSEIEAGNVSPSDSNAMQSLIARGAQYIRLKTQLESAQEAQKKTTSSVRTGTRAISERENQLNSLLDRINRQIALDKEAMLVNDKMTEAERLRAVVREDLRSTTSKLSEVEKNRVRALLDDAVAQGKKKAEMEEARKAAESMLQLQQQLNEAYKSRALQNNADLAGLVLGSDAIERMQRMVDLQQEYQRQVEALNDRFKDREVSAAQAAAYQSELDALGKHYDDMLLLEQDYQTRRAEYIANGWNGAYQAMQQYITDAGDIAGQTQELFTNAITGLEGVISDFISKGKADWRGFLDSIAAEFVRMAVRQQLSTLLQRFLPGVEKNSDAAALSSAAGQLAASAGPLLAAAAALSASAAALAAASAMSSAGSIFSGGSNGLANSIVGFMSAGGGGIGAFGFADGGFTGVGGRLQPAGLVHKGEGVLSAPEVASIGGESGFNALRKAIKSGYADGGYVSGSSRVVLGSRVPGGGMDGGGRALKVEQHFHNPRMYDRRSESQRSADSAQKLRQAVRFA